MDLLIVIDGIYLETPDGKIYSDAIYDTSFFKRYFSEFEHVYVIARVKKVSETPSKKSLLISKNITILPLPEFEGTIGYIKKHSEAMQQIKEYIHYADNIILRVPGMVSNDVFRICIKNKKRIILEVTSDPWMLLSPGTVYSPFRTIVRLYWTFFLNMRVKRRKQ